MSLRVWMPLIKQQLTQQGLSNGVLSGSPIWGYGGKISERCFRCDGPITTTINDLVNVTTFSIAYWLYIDSSKTDFTNYADFFQLQAISGNTTTVIRDELRTNTANLGRHNFHMIKDANVGSNTYTYYGLGERDDAKDKWCHIVVTKDINYCDIYADGVRYNHVACSNFESSPCKLTGVMQLGMTGCTSGYLQDFRVYDHCLSESEIKRLAQGLIVHYPLNRNGWGQENLYHYSKDFSNWTFYSGTTTVVDNGETVISYPNTADTWPGAIANKTILYSKIRNKTITVSADLKADSGISCGFDPCLLLTASETSISRLKYKDNTYNFTGTGEWIHWSATYNITDALFSSGSGSPDYTNCYFSITFYRRITPTGSFKLKNPKVEVGSVATPWCPNSSDELATTMGLNDSTEYDISGYCNNATNFTASEWSSDTPKYSVSTIFDETVLANVPNIYDSTSRHKQLTFAAWIKRTSDDANIHLYWASPAINIGLQSYQGVNNYHKIQWSHATEESVGSGRNWINTVIPLNVWTYDVWVFDSGVWKHYINGELTGTRNDSSVGEYIYGSINSTLGDDWQGALSDIRIYTTALSASDVKSLYQNCATIDPDGTIRGQIRI